MKPSPLKPGDTIGVMAPSSFVEREDIEVSTALLEERGYKVFVHPQTYEREHQSAGTHLQKTMALQGLWQREGIDAIWCAGGGNRTLHILDAINYERMKEKPKILIGFSDITTLLNAVHAHTGITTYHSTVFKNVHKYGQLDHALALMAGEAAPLPMDQARVLREGTAEGPLIGGNLSVFQYLPGTKDCPDMAGTLLFLEDNSEEYSRIDRMMAHLRRMGVLEQIGGLILGEFTDLQDTGRPFGYSLEDIVLEHTEDLDIPVIMDAPFGHGDTLYTFPVGNRAKLIVQDSISLDLTE